MAPASRVVRPAFVYALFCALAIALVVVASKQEPMPAAADGGFNFDGSIPGHKAIPAINPDPRVTWTPYTVAGMKLSNADTTITLPEGATLWIMTVNRDSLWEAD